MKLLLLFLFPLAALAAEGIYTHSVQENGAMIHQLVQEIYGTNIVVDEWYGHPTPEIVAMIHTTRGSGSGGFKAHNHSTLTWFANGGERSNFWADPGTEIPIRSGGPGSLVENGRVHSYSQKFGSTPPRLVAKRVLTGTNYDLDISVQCPVKTQFEVEERPVGSTNWRRLVLSERALGDLAEVFYDRPLLTNQSAFYRARTIWPRAHEPAKKNGPFETVIGKPAFLPTPIEATGTSSGPVMPPKK